MTFVSVNLAIIGSDNGLLPIQHQAIIGTHVSLLFVNWDIRNKFQSNFNWNSNIFIQDNPTEIVACKLAAILSQPQCMDTLLPAN